MRPLFIALFFFLVEAPAFAQIVIPPNEARKHLDEIVTVEGEISGVHFDARSKITFIDMGGRFPDQVFTAVIYKEAISSFPNVESLKGKVVDITGEVIDYYGRTEIILRSADQLKVK
jgi:DNA/RNA endonuclease YhcR with UshA esterase domain